jgi:hypothetical protein
MRGKKGDVLKSFSLSPVYKKADGGYGLTAPTPPPPPGKFMLHGVNPPGKSLLVCESHGPNNCKDTKP